MTVGGSGKKYIHKSGGSGGDEAIYPCILFHSLAEGWQLLLANKQESTSMHACKRERNLLTVNSQICSGLEWLLQSRVFSQAFDCGPIVSFAHWKRQSGDGHPSSRVFGGPGVILAVSGLNFLVPCEPTELGRRIAPSDNAFQFNFFSCCSNYAVFSLISNALDDDLTRALCGIGEKKMVGLE